MLFRSYLFDQEDLIQLKNQINPPCAGVVYVGMRPRTDGSKTGLAVQILCEVYLIGDEGSSTLVDDSSDMKIVSTEMLDAFRNAIKDTVGPGGHKWVFELETPTNFGSADSVALGYLQRWSTIAVLTSK